MSSSPVDIGDYKPCTMTPDEFGAALAIVVSARFRKQVCDLHKDDNAERKEFFEAQIQRISNNYKVHRANNVVLKKKIEDNAMLKKAFQEAMPNILASATAFHAQHTASAPAGGSNSMMTIDEILAVIKAGGSNADIEKVVGSGFHHLESQSQFLFGAAFMDVNEENQKICAENLVIQSLLDQSSSSSSTIDIGDYKPCVMTLDEFRAALAIVIPARFHKQVCDRHKDGSASHKTTFEESLGNVRDMFQPDHTANAAMKKKLDENPRAKRHFQHVRPYVVTQAHAIQGLRMAATPADDTDEMDLNDIFAAAAGAGSGEQHDRLATSALQRMDALSQGLFGLSFQTISEATHNLKTENWAIKRLLETYAKEK